VTDGLAARASKQFRLNVAAALVISSAPALPPARVGASYSHTVAAAGGTPPYQWTIVSGSLAPGLALSPEDGAITGTPSATGTFAFTVQLADSASSKTTGQLTLTVEPGLTLTTASLAAGNAGASYSQALSASGGTPPYSWSLASGTLPAGLSLDAARGVISGTPAANGTFALAVQVSDSGNLAVTRQYSLTIGLPALPSVSVSGLPDRVEPARQPVFSVSLALPYPVQLTGQATLAFEPAAEAPTDDPAIQFVTGGRAVSFTIPANSTEAVFPLPAMAFQSGTVAGKIRLAIALQANGASVEFPGDSLRDVRVERSEPRIRSARLVRRDSGFDLLVTAYSTTREMTMGHLRLNAAPGGNLQTSQIDVPVSEVVGRWYQNGSSAQFGSQLTLTLPFTLQGDAGAIESVSIALGNTAGASQPVTVKFE
jgi:hypothetical protein